MIPIAKKNALDVQQFLRSMSDTIKAALNISDFDITVAPDGSHVVYCGDFLIIRCLSSGVVIMNYPSSQEVNLPDVPVLTPLCLHNITIAVYYLIDMRASQVLQRGFSGPPTVEPPKFGDDTLFS